MQITGYRAVTCVCKGQASLCFRVSLLITVAARGLKPVGRWCYGFAYRQGHLHCFKSQSVIFLIIATCFNLQNLCEVDLVDKFLVFYWGVYATSPLEHYFGPPESSPHIHILLLLDLYGYSYNYPRPYKIIPSDIRTKVLYFYPPPCELLVYVPRVSQHSALVFDVSLTVHLSITLANDQTDAQIFNTFITIYTYMFRAISCSSSGCQIVLTLILLTWRIW
jgi:hypothetical protein